MCDLSPPKPKIDPPKNVAPPPPEPTVETIKKPKVQQRKQRKKTSTSSLKIGRSSTNTSGVSSGINL